jgi:hypothetical protein
MDISKPKISIPELEQVPDVEYCGAVVVDACMETSATRSTVSSLLEQCGHHRYQGDR